MHGLFIVCFTNHHQAVVMMFYVYRNSAMSDQNPVSETPETDAPATSEVPQTQEVSSTAPEDTGAVATSDAATRTAVEQTSNPVQEQEAIQADSTAAAQVLAVEPSSDAIAPNADDAAESAAQAAEAGLSEEERAEAARKRKEDRARKEAEQKARDEAYAELEGIRDQKARFEVTIMERVKGGLRGEYKSMRVFLPASHFLVKKHVSDDELNAAVGKTFTVVVHELQSDETGYKSAVVSRRGVLVEESWKDLTPDSVHEGTITSIMPFGVFVNIGGVEGLVHVSQLSRTRLEKPEDAFKRGETLKVKVLSADREKGKLSLSHREFEPSPWANIESTYTVGQRVKGVVQRITDFGAFVSVAPRVEGLLRVTDLSWTQRVKHPSDVVSVGQELELEVLEVSAERRRLSLGFKQTQENPWLTLSERLPVGSNVEGVVQSSGVQGLVVRVLDSFDGFIPRSKMLNAGPGKKVSVAAGETIPCVVVDAVPATSSLILAMKNADGSVAGADNGSNRGESRGEGRSEGRGERRPDRRGDGQFSVPIPKGMAAGEEVSLGDLLNEAQRKSLRNG